MENTQLTTSQKNIARLQSLVEKRNILRDPPAFSIKERALSLQRLVKKQKLLNSASQGLQGLTYNPPNLIVAGDIYMGIGLWSKKSGLTNGLPIDVMHMLLTATCLSQRINLETGYNAQIIILLADSFAINEGANSEEVKQMTQIYIKNLSHLISLLNIGSAVHIMLSSELVEQECFKSVLANIESTEFMQNLHLTDVEHYTYVLTQTAVTRYFELECNVRYKVGWITSETGKILDQKLRLEALGWDELRFDSVCKAICTESEMQYVYTLAGLKMLKSGKKEGCPYTSFDGESYLIGGNTLSTSKKMPKYINQHWKNAVEVSLSLKDSLCPNILPDKGINLKGNQHAAVFNALKYWTTTEQEIS